MQWKLYKCRVDSTPLWKGSRKHRQKNPFSSPPRGTWESRLTGQTRAVEMNLCLTATHFPAFGTTPEAEPHCLQFAWGKWGRIAGVWLSNTATSLWFLYDSIQPCKAGLPRFLRGTFWQKKKLSGSRLINGPDLQLGRVNILSTPLSRSTFQPLQ